MTIEELIKEVLKNHISVESVEYDAVADSLVYHVAGFSKSGTAELMEKDGKIICKTRYNTINEIECFDDLVDVAYEWNSIYLDTKPFDNWDADWYPVFKERGLVK